MMLCSRNQHKNVIILQLKITTIFLKIGSSRSRKIRIKYLGLNELMRMMTKNKIGRNRIPPKWLVQRDHSLSFFTFLPR